MINEKERLKEIITILKNNDIGFNMTPEKLYNIISLLGPTFIKIGQIMSNRYDILPKEYCDCLSKLRANANPMDFKEVKSILEEEYDNLEEIFQDINPHPLGSASIAQVHQATLKSGEKVVIKVQRRYIYETMAMDVKLLKKAVHLLHLNYFVQVINLDETLDEMFSTAKEEMNFEIEAKYLEEFRENNKDIAYVTTPTVYTNLTTKHVLVMEEVQGISLEKSQELIDSGYNLEEIGLKLANNYIKQALDDGLFHADPHPDNIIIRDGKIVFIDLGMMGRLSNSTRNKLKKCMQAIITNDMYEVERILISLCTTKEEINHAKLRKDLETILAKNAGTDIKEIKTIDFATSLFNILRRYNLKLNKDITMLIRGITVIEGTLELLVPNTNLMTVLSNKVKEASLKEFFSKEEVVKIGKDLLNASSNLAKIPSEFLTLTTAINRGEIKIGIEMTNSDKQVDKLEAMLHEVIIGILDASLLLGASLVQDVFWRHVYLICVVILSIWLFVKMYIDHIHKGL